MESPRLLRSFLFGSVVLLLSADLSECVMISPIDQTIVTKAQGEKVTLMCKFSLAPEDEGQLDIEWVIVQPDTEQTVILYNTGKIYDTYHMSGRVRFVDQIPSSGDGSIEILNLKPTDTGTYQCKVKKLPGIDTHRVHLTVLEKPSRTKCYIQGSQEIGTDVTLKCTSQEGSPVINYSWIKTTDTEQLPATSSLNSATGDLLVKNASQIYSGTYKCVSSNRVGTDECSLVLNITPPTNRAGTIAGAVIGTLLGLLLLAFFIFCCCKKQREKKYEKEVHHDIREDVPPPKSRASTARSYIGSNRSSLGSMSPSNMDGYAKTQYNKVPSEDFDRTPAQNPNFQPPKISGFPSFNSEYSRPSVFMDLTSANPYRQPLEAVSGYAGPTTLSHLAFVGPRMSGKQTEAIYGFAEAMSLQLQLLLPQGFLRPMDASGLHCGPSAIQNQPPAASQ